MGNASISATGSAPAGKGENVGWRSAAETENDDRAREVAAAYNSSLSDVAGCTDNLSQANTNLDAHGIDTAIDTLVDTLAPKKAATVPVGASSQAMHAQHNGHHHCHRQPQHPHPHPHPHHAHDHQVYRPVSVQPDAGGWNNSWQSTDTAPAAIAASTLDAEDEDKLDLLKRALQNHQPPIPPGQIERILEAVQARLQENRQVARAVEALGRSASNSSGEGNAPVLLTPRMARFSTSRDASAPAPVGSVQPSGSYAVGAPGSPANWYAEPNPALMAKIQEVQDPALKSTMLAAATQPVGHWLTRDVSGDQVRNYGDRALAAGKTPFYVTYARDMIDQHGAQKLFSSGGASGSKDEYLNKIRQWGSAIGDRDAVIALEPDAFAQSRLASPADRQHIRDELVDAGKMLRTMCPNATILLPIGAGKWGEPADVAAQVAPMLKAEVNGVPVFNGLTVGEAGSTPDLARDWGYSIVDALENLGVPGMKVLEDSSRNGVEASNGNGDDPSNWANNPRRAAGPKAGGATDPRSLGNVYIKTAELSDGRTSPAGSLDFAGWTTLIRNATAAGVAGW